MSRLPAHITQADIARALRAAKQEGATEIEVRIDGQASIVIRLGQNETPSLVPDNEVVL